VLSQTTPLLFQYPWTTRHHDILDWHLFAFLIVFMFWCLFLTTHIIMTFLNSIYNFSHLADTSNYASWATNIKFILMNKDLWAVVSGTSFKPVVELDGVNTLNLKFSPEYIVWSRKNDRACATIALSCQDDFKRFIQNPFCTSDVVEAQEVVWGSGL